MLGAMNELLQQTYRVEGMTCEHCVAAVSAEISEIPGVSGVEVDLDAGRVVVSGSGVAREDVRAAVEEAGYSLAA